jgi:predicted ATP-dependent protease
MNIEREARMSGKIHDKGFIILTGYLQGKYGQDRPLSLQASIGFEQSYSEVDGDSASRRSFTPCCLISPVFLWPRE